MTFFESLQDAALHNNSLVCVGLDPRPDRIPAAFRDSSDPVFAFNRHIIDRTRDLVCAYKPNYAFYEALGLDGLQALRRTIDYIGDDVPVILDAKRGDIGSTAEAYAYAAFETWGAGAVTVNPYLGRDSIEPFSSYTERGVFILCHTSNPGAADMQTLDCAGQPLYQRVARLAAELNAAGNIGLVVGATYPERLRAVREIMSDAWILLPGVGAQGGDLSACLAAGLRPDGLGLIVNSSRDVIFAADPRAAAIALRDRINADRSGGPADGVALGLFDAGCVRFGEFTLKSGKASPIYIDLRLLASHPHLMRSVARAYALVLAGLEYDRLAAIPYAGLPIGAAVSLETGRPFIYPRKEIKQYGTRQPIEGAHSAGERVVVLDDLITTGASKLEALQPLLDAGLLVEDVVVLIDRQSGGREDLAGHGLRLHSLLTLAGLLDALTRHGRIEQTQADTVAAWLKNA